MRAFLGLGSNLGNRQSYLREAVKAMPHLVAVSAVYETAPVGGPPQPNYLNAVVELDTPWSPRLLLEHCFSLEIEAGRQRRVRWGPRTLDVDLLWVEGAPVDELDLVVPHPRMSERGFVVAPFLQIAPDLEADISPIPEALAAIDEGEVLLLGPL